MLRTSFIHGSDVEVISSMRLHSWACRAKGSIIRQQRWYFSPRSNLPSDSGRGNQGDADKALVGCRTSDE